MKRFIVSIVLMAALVAPSLPQGKTGQLASRDSRWQTRSGIGDDSGGSRRE